MVRLGVVPRSASSDDAPGAWFDRHTADEIELPATIDDRLKHAPAYLRHIQQMAPTDQRAWVGVCGATDHELVREATAATYGMIELIDDAVGRILGDDYLNKAFDSGLGAPGAPYAIVGADYQRAFSLSDGRVLWVFQDVFVEHDDGTRSFVHNAGAVQTGGCFTPLVGGEGAPESWLGADRTVDHQRWFWPLDGYEDGAGNVVVFVAEMHERGPRYLSNPEPVATMTITIETDSWSAGSMEKAPDPSNALYGFEIVHDDQFRYLYAQCHRQFGYSWLGHDECAASVTVARHTLDGPRRPLEYSDGARWTRNSRAAANIAPLELPDGALRNANPMQIERDGDRWIAVTKPGDWWGDVVVFDVAPAPQGPWTTTAVVSLDVVGPNVSGPMGPDELASYFVSFVPSDDQGWTLAMSQNRWDGAFSGHYRPRFRTVGPLPWSEFSDR